MAKKTLDKISVQELYETIKTVLVENRLDLNVSSYYAAFMHNELVDYRPIAELMAINNEDGNMVFATHAERIFTAPVYALRVNNDKYPLRYAADKEVDLTHLPINLRNRLYKLKDSLNKEQSFVRLLVKVLPVGFELQDRIFIISSIGNPVPRLVKGPKQLSCMIDRWMDHANILSAEQRDLEARISEIKALKNNLDKKINKTQKRIQCL